MAVKGVVALVELVSAPVVVLVLVVFVGVVVVAFAAALRQTYTMFIRFSLVITLTTLPEMLSDVVASLFADAVEVQCVADTEPLQHLAKERLEHPHGCLDCSGVLGFPYLGCRVVFGCWF